MSEIESWPASAWLMVRFTTNANRLMGTVGGDTPSRRKTTIPVGESVMLVTDFGQGLVDVAWKKDRYRVFRGDLMLAPSPPMVAHNAVEVQRLGNELRLLRAEHDRVLTQKQQGDADYASLNGEMQRVFAERDRLRDQLTTALEQGRAALAEVNAKLERMTDANGRNLWRADEAELRLEWVKEALTKDVSDVLS